MVDYENLRATVDPLLRCVRYYGQGKIEEILEEFNNIEGNTLYACRRLVSEISEDKRYCKLIDVNYTTLPKEDLKRVKVLALLLAKEDPDMVLPML